ncbi:MAG TPA: hypothetical protein VL172_21635, partial [Kofleriaceae bacterium]|nr:hypothetical protein [Kofleriaceae bacterium]
AVCEEVGGLVDRMICAVTPENLYAVGLWYADFTQTSDEEVRELLKESTWDRTSTRYGSP